ncbi:MAG: DUF5107 domain-containing protein [Planctomycetota bacterium]
MSTHSVDQPRVWHERITLKTYPVGEPRTLPMFLDKRVYQGSSGKVYPLPVIDSIGDEPIDQEYDAVYLENRYLLIMLLPGLGGRVHRALDKTNGYDFVYHNHVIKPALVGLAGPWVCGGIEFNWPQHHRPSTFDPVEYTLQTHGDGSVTAWMGETEKMTRTRGLTGFTLRPDSAVLEIEGRLHNRTRLPQSFLWWANPAVSVNENYQSVFPPDVTAVMDHGKRDVCRFPIATGEYYKVDYSAGVDISRYANIPVPTSYMVAHSAYDFFGGYDHGRDAGILHVADHHIAPGKKQWTWGNGPFGDMWTRQLTDNDGPYIELMAGVYTDNQPDFTWLAPGESRSFKQHFLPYKQLSVVKNATTEAALALDVKDQHCDIGVYLTRSRRVRVSLGHADEVLFDWEGELDPTEALQEQISLPDDVSDATLTLEVIDASTSESLVAYQRCTPPIRPLPDAATEPPKPADAQSIDQLLTIGTHLEQYRHATRRPEPYYAEALRRQPTHHGANLALGRLAYRNGDFARAADALETAVAAQSRHNTNPYHGEALYLLGLCRVALNERKAATNAFARSAWSATHAASAHFELARLRCSDAAWAAALHHLDTALETNAVHHGARHLRAAIHRRMGYTDAAARDLDALLRRDPLHPGALWERAITQDDKAHATVADALRNDAANYLELAYDYAAAGLFEESDAVAQSGLQACPEGVGVWPMLAYARADLALTRGDHHAAKAHTGQAEAATPGTCFPHRLESIAVLQRVIQRFPDCGRACYYLGNLWYDKGQHPRAVACWKQALTTQPDHAPTHRNLGLAYFNTQHDTDAARHAYDRAVELDPTNARLRYEHDQLRARLGDAPEARLEALEPQAYLVNERDDLYLAYVTLLNTCDQHQEAREALERRVFHPWEGGEGKVLGQWVYAHVALACEALEADRPNDAIDLLQAGKQTPANLGEGRLPTTSDTVSDYWLGVAFKRLGQHDEAIAAWEAAAAGDAEPTAAVYYNDRPPEAVFYQGLALAALGRADQAASRFHALLAYGERHLFDEPEIDYFAVSLPDFLVFEPDRKQQNQVHCWYMIGLGRLGLGQPGPAADAFERALRHDPAHQGVRTHQSLTDVTRFNQPSTVGEPA